ncbi:MAG: hypothetical protein ACK5QC_12755 [Bacteroidota bacterium]|jgi:hypothetical protein
MANRLLLILSISILSFFSKGQEYKIYFKDKKFPFYKLESSFFYSYSKEPDIIFCKKYPIINDSLLIKIYTPLGFENKYWIHKTINNITDTLTLVCTGKLGRHSGVRYYMFESVKEIKQGENKR